ncbi:MAG: metallophosphatase domain-containing protein [Proteobacteria bacterium]|nr:metallophosphatase domain-containing protein [Pseudomonadota bacterium]
MRIVIVSDTHGHHGSLGELSGDVLVHCGDAFRGGARDPADVDRLDDWFGRQRFGCILCVGGNHDFELERRALRPPVFRHAIYLEDAEHSFAGVRFYGAPWVPQLAGWAYYRPDAELRDRWSRVPPGIDVLVTHTPAAGILDRNRAGVSLGCRELRERLRAVRPRLHLFGHTHASAGVETVGPTLHVNAALVDSQYRLARAPFVVELDAGTQAPARLAS